MSFKSMSEAVNDAQKKVKQRHDRNILAVKLSFEQKENAIIPRDTSTMAKNTHTEVLRTSGSVGISSISDTPYAKKVYYVSATTGPLRWKEVVANQNKELFKKIISKK